MILSNLYSQAGGMAVVRPYDFEIDFVRNPISESAAWFFVIFLKFIFTPIFEIKICEKKNSSTPKKFHFPEKFVGYINKIKIIIRYT